jgi:predicted chitinase
MTDRTAFFERVRTSVFGGRLNQGQVDGCNAILDYWDSRYDGADHRWIAYSLATTVRETGASMAPLREIGYGAGHPYGAKDPNTGQCYYGRGFCQITWNYNYRRIGNAIGVDLLNKPDLALSVTTATQILVEGMVAGWFTGHRLNDYFNASVNDATNARRIINGLDHAGEVALTHRALLDALT